jgi:hypothetical protein
MAALGVGALVGFALDALWHEAYRIDVTLWSPTHLMLVGGGGLPTIAVRLILIEGRPAGRATAPGRAIAALSLGAILVGLSCFEGEFDFGVPQFQVIYLPVLIAATAGFALVLARAALGPRAARRTTWPAVAGYSGLAVMVALWTGLIAFVAHRLSGVEPVLPTHSDPDLWRYSASPDRSTDSDERDHRKRRRGLVGPASYKLSHPRQTHSRVCCSTHVNELPQRPPTSRCHAALVTISARAVSSTGRAKDF